jgi:HK97 family phage major capsid protein
MVSPLPCAGARDKRPNLIQRKSDNMATEDLVKGLEAQIKTVGEEIKREIEGMQSANAEARKAIEDRVKTLEDFSVKLTADLEEKRRYTLPGSEPNQTTGEKFSTSKACRAIAQNNWEGAGFEKEVFDNMREKAMSSGVDSAGGFIVPEQAIPEVIEALKANTVSLKLGAREIPATGAPLNIPRLSTSATAAWIGGENASITASDLAFENLTMNPNTLAARVLMSNQLLELSSPAADAIINEDIASQLSIGLDTGVMQGTGVSGQPLGIINTTGVGTQTATDATVTYLELVGFINELAVDNALKGKLGWAMNPALFTQIMKLPTITAASAGAAQVDVTRHAVADAPPTMILGYPYELTTALTGTSGVGANSIIFANWDDVLIAMWGGLRLRAQDTGDSAFSTDQTHIRAILRADVRLRHPQSACIAS